MEHYTADTIQSPETIRRFSEVKFNIFQMPVKLAGVLISVLLVLAGGFAVKSEGLSLLLIFLGCVLFTNLNAPANYLANRVIALFHGRFPVLHYSFSETGMKIEDKKPETTYSAFIRLVEDEDYLYLFQSSQYGTMVKKSTVQGDGEADGLKMFLTEKTSLKWVAPPSVLSFNLKHIRSMGKAAGGPVGPRLRR